MLRKYPPPLSSSLSPLPLPPHHHSPIHPRQTPSPPFPQPVAASHAGTQPDPQRLPSPVTPLSSPCAFGAAL
ncbi:unnamed protein product [Closterium sp. NIES-54]